MFYRIYRSVGGVLAVLAGIALLVMMVLTFVDVVGRYGFNRSIFGASEMIEVLMVITLFAGLSFVTASNDHIVVSIFEERINSRFPNFHRWVVHVLSLSIMGLVTWELWRSGVDSFQSDKRLVVLDVPQWILPISAAILLTAGLFLLTAAIIATKGHLERIGGHGDDHHDDAGDPAKGK